MKEEDTELRKREVGFPVHPLCSSPPPLPPFPRAVMQAGFAKGALVSNSPRSSSSYVGRETARAWRGNLSPSMKGGRREGGEPPFISLSLTALCDRRSLSPSFLPATTLSNKWLPKSGSTMFTCFARARAAFKFSRVNPVPPLLLSTSLTVNKDCQRPKRRNG